MKSREDITKAVDKVCNILGTITKKTNAERSAYEVLTSNAETEKLVKEIEKIERMPMQQARDYKGDAVEKYRRAMKNRDLSSRKKKEAFLEEIEKRGL